MLGRGTYFRSAITYHNAHSVKLARFKFFCLSKKHNNGIH